MIRKLMFMLHRDHTRLAVCIMLTSTLLLPLGHNAQSSEIALIETLLVEKSRDDLPGIKKRKKMRALVPYSRTDFTIMENGKPRGLQVELLIQYEKILNRGVKREVDKIRIILIPTTFDRLIPDLQMGKGDIAAALLTITPERKKQVSFATGGAMKINELVVINKDVVGINSLEDLAGREVYVLKGSSYVEHLRAINRQFSAKGLKLMMIREADSRLLSEDILEMVNAGIVPITVVDDYKANIWASVLPNIQVLQKISVKTGATVGWAIRKNNPKLQESLNTFAQTVKKGTLLGNILFKRYFNSGWIKNPLAEDERSKFRKVINVFSKYANRYKFEVLAVTAQAYQESLLDNSKQSHRGAVGIMQVLPSTASDRHVGIADITSLENNIHAGVKYLSFLREHYFSDSNISRENRLALTWAAYNAGPGNIIKMRKLTKKMGLDPNVWFGNVELAAAKIIGRETIQYVRNIFKYYIAYSLAQDLLFQPD